MSKNKKYYFLVEDLGEKRSGIENASLGRSKLFNQHLKVYPTIITTLYNPKLNKQRKILVDAKLINPETQIVNLYEFFQETITYQYQYPISAFSENKHFEYQKVNEIGDYRISSNNELVIYRKCDNTGTLIYNNLFMNKKKVRRNWYDSNGYLSKVQNLNPSTGDVQSEAFYRIDGSICIYKHYEKVNEKNNLTGIHLMDRKNEIIQSFKSETEFIQYWFSLLFTQEYEHILIIDKERIFFPALLNFSKHNIKIICAIHSSHLSAGQDKMSGKLNSNYRQIFENLNVPDAIVLLTDKQKEHITNRFSNNQIFHVIPHTIDVVPKKILPDSRIKKSAIYLGRFSEEKQHKHLIQAFSKVVLFHPDARLDFYGFGSLERDFRHLIKDLNLEEHVFINGYVNDVGLIYDNASLALLPSKVEGFSLFLLECLAHGCPIIAYDIDYSPSDMIDDQVNGFLVDANQIEQLADKIIYYFDHPELVASFSDAAYAKFHKFSPEKVVKKWEELLDKI